MKREIKELFPGRAYGKKEEVNVLRKSDAVKSSISAKVQIPILNTFTLCFWIRTKDDSAQIFAIIYDNNDNKPRIDVSIRKGKLILILDGKTR